MIAVDTNVLLRHLLQDDAVQSPKASELIEQHERVLVTDVVLVECIWTLSGKKYQASREDIVTLVTDLVREPAIVFENPQAIWAALNDFQAEYPAYDADGRKWKLPDFADALIIHKAKQTAKQWREMLDGVYSFDVGALRIAGTRTL
ncbi:type II toxin-antitoxin system VapC family toxin [Thiothrix subterranea]|uniref:PIN domain-containing protein n=1 Tax=Thiothrix subterranea TaxID=2735563 RepID=UPI00192B3679|nr:type II toxin-antitoxin system VapC family toxin [Thiothrix subterranea]QQZ29555.1 type II toxin-antitoxin system VapC family toxin [Thiothrix subterranea]